MEEWLVGNSVLELYIKMILAILHVVTRQMCGAGELMASQRDTCRAGQGKDKNGIRPAWLEQATSR